MSTRDQSTARYITEKGKPINVRIKKTKYVRRKQQQRKQRYSRQRGMVYEIVDSMQGGES